MKFKYKKYADILRPVIPVRVRSGGWSIQHEVLVDSGADLCFFSSEVGQAIGFDVFSGIPREVFGIGGKSSWYYLHHIVLEIGGLPFEVEAGFMPEVAGRILPYGVVGQKGFFEHFIVKFDLQKEEIELKAKVK